MPITREVTINRIQATSPLQIAAPNTGTYAPSGQAALMWQSYQSFDSDGRPFESWTETVVRKLDLHYSPDTGEALPPPAHVREATAEELAAVELLLATMNNSAAAAIGEGVSTDELPELVAAREATAALVAVRSGVTITAPNEIVIEKGSLS